MKKDSILIKKIARFALLMTLCIGCAGILSGVCHAAEDSPEMKILKQCQSNQTKIDIAVKSYITNVRSLPKGEFDISTLLKAGFLEAIPACSEKTDAYKVRINISDTFIDDRLLDVICSTHGDKNNLKSLIKKASSIIFSDTWLNPNIIFGGATLLLLSFMILRRMISDEKR